MAEKYFYVPEKILGELNAKFDEWKAKTDNPAEYRFVGFAARQTMDHEKLFFHPLYESSLGGKSVVFTEVVTAGECPNPPGYTEPISSWPEAIHILSVDKSSQTASGEPSNDPESADTQEPSSNRPS